MPDDHPLLSALESHPRLRELFEGPGSVELPVLTIAGVEVTQAVQFYAAGEHLGDPKDRGPDNGIRIIAGKPAWVRVYPRALYEPLPGVDGRLELYRREQGVNWNKVAELAPVGVVHVDAEVDPDYAQIRAELGDTLNFVLPAALVCGHLRLVVNIADAAGHAARHTERIDATCRQTLRARIVPVAYQGVDAEGEPLTLPGPDLAAAQATASWAATVYPVEATPMIELGAGTILKFPLTGAPISAGSCSASWLNLNAHVAAARTADGNLPNTFYYGLVPADVPVSANHGCASAGVASGMVGARRIFAHELGHALGFAHAPCGGVGATVDASYPAYEPYDPGGTPGGSIGEYGLDVNDGAIKEPAVFRDLMGYCQPGWISIHNYRRALDHVLLRPRRDCEDRRWWVAPDFMPELTASPTGVGAGAGASDEGEALREPVVALVGILEPGRRFELRSLTRAVAVPQVPGGRATGMIVELVDAQGRRLSAAPLWRLPACGCVCGGPGADEDGPALVLAYLPTARRGAALRLLEGDGERERWRLRAPAHEPRPAELGATITRAGALALRWTVPDEGDAGDEDRLDPPDPRELWIRCASRGRPPRVLWIARGPGALELNPGRLPPGAARFDIVSHDGFSTATSAPVSLEIPARPPTPAILHPLTGQVLRADHPMRLHGLGNGCGGGLLEAEACRWRLDGDPIATGSEAWIQAPGPGEHELVLEVRDRFGRAEQAVNFETV